MHYVHQKNTKVARRGIYCFAVAPLGNIRRLCLSGSLYLSFFVALRARKYEAGNTNMHIVNWRGIAPPLGGWRDASGLEAPIAEEGQRSS